MAKLIDAEVAAKAVCYNCMDQYDCKDRCTDYMEVFNVPTVDAVEVVHGRWIRKEQKDHPFSVLLPHCSKCGALRVQDTANYCSNCGARMDGDGDG